MDEIKLKIYVDLVVEASDLKTLREDLCIVHQVVYNSRILNYERLCNRINHLINEIDRHRPLGPDGKHGNLHTPTCGCEDNKEEVNGSK